MIRSIFALFRSSPQSTRRAPNRVKVRSRVIVEYLEVRDCPATLTPEHMFVNGASQPLATVGPTGLTPTQVRHAYGFDQVNLDGSGTTIAIVDAYDDPNIANDLKQFDAKFGLPDPVFTKVNQNGGTSLPRADKGWASEIALDVEWAHAIAPKANVLLVEANSASDADLFQAVRWAAAQPNVVVVSMSFGGGEYGGQTVYDTSFVTPTGHAGVTFIASSGDSGSPASYPATSPNVLAVGGTTMNVNSSGTITSETGWSGSGGGVSSVEPFPTYQKTFLNQTLPHRANPDVAYDADPNTGFPVYDSYNNGTSRPWSQFGGTSDAAPQWAGLIALVDQGRIAAGLGSLDGPSQTLPLIYQLPAADFHDITSGTSTGTPNQTAAVGYDLVTGRGSPVANLVIADLIGQSVTPTASKFTVSAPSTSVAGGAISVTVTAVNSSGATMTNYTGTVRLSSSDAASGLPATYTFTAGEQGKHTFTVTLKTAGSQSITATDTSSSITGSTNVSVSPAAASKLAFSQQPASVVVNAVISPAVTVRVLDTYGNLVTGDNTDVVTLALSAGATLGGTTSANVSGGIATFANLTVTAVGSYTLTASSGSLTGATSASFSVTTVPSGSVLEDFESPRTWTYVGGRSLTATRTTSAAHDGSYGLDDTNGNDWIYRSDAAAKVKAGDTISVWLEFPSIADGRAYFAFGASSFGTLSLVAAPNTNQLILQSNVNYGFNDLAAVNQTYQANHWYRLEVNWSTTGAIVGKIFDSNGTTLLNSVSASTSVITSGGFGFRGTGGDKYWDTVTLTPGVNSFTAGSLTTSNPPTTIVITLGGGSIWQTTTTITYLSPSSTSSASSSPSPAASPAPPESFWSSYWFGW